MKKPRGKIGRAAALAGKPERLPVVRTKELPDGGLNVTVRLTPRPWLRWLETPEPVERTFTLDRLGREVYDACDGKTDAKTIIRRFAESHKVSIAEAELSVATFLKTLMSKAVIAVAIDRKKEEGG